MKPRHLLGTVLLLVGLAGLAIAGYRIFTTPAAGAAQGAPAAAETSKAHTIVYYFHTNKRCATCNKIEELTQSTIELAFADELARGELELRIRNIDESQYAHYRDEYDLDFGTVVVVSQRPADKGRHERLDDVWKLNHDEIAFDDYLQSHIRPFLTAHER